MADSFEAEARETIAHCLPHLADDEIATAVEAFLGYLDVVNDIYDAVQDSPERSAALDALTANLQRATFETGLVESIKQEQSSLHA